VILAVLIGQRIRSGRTDEQEYRMRLARHGVPGQERPIISGEDGEWRDLTPVAPDITGEFLRDGLTGLEIESLPAVAEIGRFGAPLAQVGKIVCIGLNYRDHAAETGARIPAEPILFLKTPDTVVGPDDEVLVPRGSTKTDWEVELAVVIGAQARYLAVPEDAAECIAGYAISNDVSERAFQLERGGQWDKGKNCETFNPLGPWIRTADEVADPQQLGLRLWVNGELRQDGTTEDMIFGVHHLIWYLSQFLVLRPGDVVNTGTPAGVAMGRADQPFLRAGDVVEIEIDGLGRQRQQIGQA
jgi:2-keto-4-pentenoate hydratase/2-oxohepta-3-ene-1,7-dioic acid hydratase in catechol pathway